MTALFLGLTSHVHAFRLLAKNRKIRRLALIPFLVNTLLFLVGIPFAIWGGVDAVNSLFGDSSWWLQAINIIVQILVVLLIILAAFFLFTLIGSIISGPFNGPLSEAVEQHEREVRGLDPVVAGDRGLMQDAWRGVVFGVGRLILFLLVYPLIFLTQFIPVLGPFLSPVLFFLYSVFVLSIDFNDPTLDRHMDTFREKLSYVWKRKATYIGFGAGALCMMLIPFVNLLVIPVCVVAAARLYVAQESS